MRTVLVKQHRTARSAPPVDLPQGVGDAEHLVIRLRRVEGQVRGLQRLVQEDRDCIEILTQVAAATKALEAVAMSLLETHLYRCVEQARRSAGDCGPVLQEAAAAVRRLVR